MRLVILEVVIADIRDAYHAIGVRLGELDIEAALGDSRDDSIELLADTFCEEFRLLHLDTVALGVCGGHLPLRGVERKGIESRHFLFGNRRAARFRLAEARSGEAQACVRLDESMDDEVGIPAGGGGEGGGGGKSEA